MDLHIQSYINELIKYLYTVNGNVDWHSFINKYMSADIKILLTKIKSLIWVDKELSYDNGMQENMKLFMYYTKLLNKYQPLFDTDKLTLYILDVNSNNNIDDFIVNIVKNKINVLCRLLDVMNIKYELINKIQSSYDLVIPTGSITYNEPTEMFKNFNGILIADDLYNIYQSEEQKELNFFKLSILQLSKNGSITIDEILNQQYGFLKYQFKSDK